MISLRSLVVFSASMSIALVSATNPTNQTCSTLPCVLGTTFADVVVVLDTSVAMGAANLLAVKQFFHKWISMYTIGPGSGQVQFAFVTYHAWADSDATLSQASPNARTLNIYIDDVIKLPTIDTNDRNIHDALIKVHNNLLPFDSNSGYRNTTEHLLLVISAANFTGTPSDWMPDADNVRDYFDHFLAIGMGEKSISSNYAELITMTGNATNVFLAPRAEDLQFVLAWLLERTCRNSRQSLLPYS